MNDVLEIALILDHQRYKNLYYFGICLGIFFIMALIIIFTCKYQSYYITLGTMIDNKLELLVNIKDLKYIKENNILTIDGHKYKYHILEIDEKMYRDDNFNNYKNVYLEVSNLRNIDNYVYEVKIPTEYKVLASYIKDHI